MNSSKIDFISNLLAHKNIDAADKERLFLLANEEVKKKETYYFEISKIFEGYKKFDKKKE